MDMIMVMGKSKGMGMVVVQLGENDIDRWALAQIEGQI